MNNSFSMGVNLSELNNASEWLRSRAEDFGIPEKEVFTLDLALEEIVTNIIKYAFEGTFQGECISVTFEMEPNRVVLSVLDHGKPFDPLQAPPPQHETDIQKMKIGGLGIHLTRQLMDGMDYVRRDGKNVLTVWKNLTR